MGIAEIIQLAIILAVSIGLHEYAHAYASHTLWDPTPKLQNRLTPNPLHHIDPVGFLMIFLVHFWRGKPVQINPMYYKHPLKWELLVSLAGPATNLVLAIAGILIMLIYAKITGVTAMEMINMPNMVITFWSLFAQINIALAIFNLIPIYPLDGYRLVKIIKPAAGFWMEKNGMVITIVFLFLLVGPLSGVFGSIISHTTDFVFRIFFTIFGQTFY